MNDWQNINPLTESIAISLVRDHLATIKLVGQKIPENNNGQGNKTPDLLILNNNTTIALGEVKTPELTLDPIIKMYLWRTTFYKIRKFVHKAYKQFEIFDKSHKLPRILFFTSNHPQLNWTSLVHNITGVVGFDSTLIKDFRDLTFLSDSNKELNQIDAIVWLQINYIKPEVFQHFEYYNETSKHASQLKQHLSQLSSKISH